MRSAVLMALPPLHACGPPAQPIPTSCGQDERRVDDAPRDPDRYDGDPGNPEVGIENSKGGERHSGEQWHAEHEEKRSREIRDHHPQDAPYPFALTVCLIQAWIEITAPPALPAAGNAKQQECREQQSDPVDELEYGPRRRWCGRLPTREQSQYASRRFINGSQMRETARVGKQHDAQPGFRRQDQRSVKAAGIAVVPDRAHVIRRSDDPSHSIVGVWDCGLQRPQRNCGVVQFSDALLGKKPSLASTLPCTSWPTRFAFMSATSTASTREVWPLPSPTSASFRSGIGPMNATGTPAFSKTR